MLTQNFISVQTIIAKLYRDLGLTDEELFTDIIEWCGEAMDLIHCYPQYREEDGCVEIYNYKGELPGDFIALRAAEYGGASVNYSNGLFGPLTNQPVVRRPYSINEDKISNVLLLDPSRTHNVGSAQIKIENGYIKTSFDKGHINIRYAAMILDEDGFPMIPDDQSFKEALYWFCNYKITYAQSRRGEIQIQFYTDAYNKWQWYCGQAGTSAIAPDLGTMENIKHLFTQARPNTNKFNTFFNR